VEIFKNRFSFLMNSQSRLVVSQLFLLWWLTMPFQSKILGISLGPLTIYPNLILSLILAPSVLLCYGKLHKYMLALLVFLIGWFIYGLVFGSIQGWNAAAVFDVRNLGLQVLFAIVLVGMFGYLGKDKFMNQVRIGLKSMLLVFFIVGFIEFLTGIHFAGDKTLELITLPVGNNFYAPMFIFDNQNTFLTYIIGTHLLLIVLDRSWRENKWRLGMVWMGIFLFAVYADSNFAKWIVYLNLGYLAFQHGIERFSKKKLLIGGLLGAMLLLTFYQNTLFYGPLLENSASFRINTLTLLESDSNGYTITPAREKLSNQEQKKVIGYMDSIHKNNPEKSVNVRKQMILLGAHLIKEKPFTGVGPGGYATESVNQNKQFHMGTQRSPHNFPLEIISQYGLIGWIYFGFLGFICISIVRISNSFLSFENGFFCVVLCSLFFIWMMPSSFMLLEIHRLILPLFLVVLLVRKTEVNNG
jgi:hypothetical protein